MPEVNSEKAAEFLQVAMDRFKLADEAESDFRGKALDDLKFSIGEQWPTDVATRRKGTVMLTINRFPQFIKRVTNEQRQQRNGIQISPIGDDADTDTAEILQGIIRHIEVNSDADVAYDHAFDCMVRTGIGWWRILTEYVDDESSEQEIRIEWIKNQFSVFSDPHARKPDRSDAKWRFIIEDVPRDEFVEEYDKAEAGRIEFTGLGNSPPGWITKESIRVAEYFVLTQNGRKKSIKWHKITAKDILDSRDIPGTIIPVIPVLGDDLDIDGEQHLAGLVRNGKDAQRAYNYSRSKTVEAVALAPTAPWVAVEGQLEGREEEWKSANIRNLTVLQYKAVDVEGKPAPPPQRQSVEPPIQAMTVLTSEADQDLQATTGIYNPSLGKTEGEQSGKAVLARQRQSDISTFNYSDNLARSLRTTGRVLLPWVRTYYPNARVQRIIKPDGTHASVVIHNGAEQADEAKRLLTEKINKIYDIGVGRYDVAVSTGPSYQSKRQEAVASIMALIQAAPQVMPIVGDLLVGAMDWPNATEIAKRLKKMLPPQLQDSDNPEEQMQQLQQQHAAMAQELQALTQELQKSQLIIETKKVEQQGKFQIAQMQEDSKQSIEMARLENQRAIAEITTKAQNARERAKLENDTWLQQHSDAHERGMQAVDHAQEHSLADKAAENAAASQATDQSHESAMAEQAAANQNDTGGTQ